MVADFNSNLYNVTTTTQTVISTFNETTNTTVNRTVDVTTVETFDDLVGNMTVKFVKITLMGNGQLTFDSFSCNFCRRKNGKISNKYIYFQLWYAEIFPQKVMSVGGGGRGASIVALRILFTSIRQVPTSLHYFCVLPVFRQTEKSGSIISRKAFKF